MNKKKRRKIPDRLSGFFSPEGKFAFGILFMLLYLFNPHLSLKCGQLVLLILLAFLSGKRIRILYFAMFVFWIALFQLLSPYGRVLLDLRFLKVTEGALFTGLEKGLTLVGLVVASLFSITPGLRIPGSLGAVLANALLHYEQLYAVKQKVSRRTFIRDVDALLFSLYPGDSAAESAIDRSIMTPGGWIAGSVMAALMAAVTITGRILTA